MTITPQDIQSQQFHIRFRGFDVEEVDGFLERVAEEFLLLQEEKKQALEQTSVLKQQIESFQSQEKTFQKAILSAQRISDEMKEKSRIEAEEILEQARQEANELREEATREVSRLEAEVDRLQTMKGQIRADLRQLLENYLARVDEEVQAPQLKPETTPEELSFLAGETSTAPTAELEEPVMPEFSEENTYNPSLPAEAGEAAEDSFDEQAAAEETAAAPDEMPVVDLSDLYERIELPEDEETENIPATEGGSEDDEDTDVRNLFGSETFVAEPGEEETSRSTLPDLEGDMLFTLEDPLDEQEEPTLDLEDEEEPEAAGSEKKDS